MTAIEGATLWCDGVAFDADGVLFDSTAAVVAAWTELCVRHDLEVERVFTHGIPADELLTDWLHRGDLPRAVAWLEAREVELAVELEPLPGAAELLADVPAGRAAIVTSASRRLLLARLAASGLAAPEVCITADDVSAGKPDPGGYTAAAAQLGVQADRLVVFEDSPAGVRAAKRAGAATVGLTTTHHPVELPADHHIADLTEARVATHQPLSLTLGRARP